VAQIVVIVDANNRVVGVEKRPGSTLRTAKVLFDALADARTFRRTGVGTDRGLIKRELEYSDRRQYADDILSSPLFTDEQKSEWYALLSGRVFALDYHSSERTPRATVARLGATVQASGPGPDRRQMLMSDDKDP
jgi:hypothetical protein